jgi:hypothetical protein
MSFDNTINQNNPLSGLILPLASLLTTYINKKLTLDVTLYGFVFTAVQQLLTEICKHNEYIVGFINVKIGLLMLAIYVLYSYKDTIKEYFKLKEKDDFIDHLVINLYDQTKIEKFLTYVKAHPQFYSKPNQLNFGDPDLISKSHTNRIFRYLDDHSTYTRSCDRIRISFTDTNFDVVGYYYWSTTNLKVKDNQGTSSAEVEVKYPYIVLGVQATSTEDINDYFEKMVAHNKKRLYNTSILYSVKIMLQGSEVVYSTNTMYNGLKKSLRDLEKLHMDTFFHKDKEKFWKILKTINFNPEKFLECGQSPRIGLFLYGPGGTGKSSFAYRIAMCLQRHVLTVDLRTIRSRYKVFELMRNPLINHYHCNPNEVVYVFDEFDLTVEELYYKNKGMSVVQNRWQDTMTKTNFDVDFFTGKDKEPEDKKSKFGDRFSLEKYGYDTESLTLEDLKEIFQGVVPQSGMIVIATTNKFEKIKELCPELFRPGRLTPIYFGFPNADIVNEMSKHHFGETIGVTNEKYNAKYPTSQIVDLIMEAKLLHENENIHEEKSNVETGNRPAFEHFQREFTRLIT